MAVRRWRTQQAEEALAATIARALFQGARRLQQATNTGACLMLQMSTVNGTELAAQEWCDSLFLLYVIDPPNLPKYCDGCNAKSKI